MEGFSWRTCKKRGWISEVLIGCSVIGLIVLSIAVIRNDPKDTLTVFDNSAADRDVGGNGFGPLLLALQFRDGGERLQAIGNGGRRRLRARHVGDPLWKQWKQSVCSSAPTRRLLSLIVAIALIANRNRLTIATVHAAKRHLK
jgi:hypothetical protein